MYTARLIVDHMVGKALAMAANARENIMHANDNCTPPELKKTRSFSGVVSFAPLPLPTTTPPLVGPTTPPLVGFAKVILSRILDLVCPTRGSHFCNFEGQLSKSVEIEKMKISFFLKYLRPPDAA